MALSLLSNLLSPGQQFLTGILSSARRFFGNDPSKMAQALSGSTDKKSKEYKSELRNIQRWYTNKGTERRKPGQKSLFQLGRYVEWGIKLKAVILNDSPGHDNSYPRTRSISIRLGEQTVSKIRGSLLRGDSRSAFDAVWDAYGYNPRRDGSLRSLDIVDLRPI